MGKSGKDVDDFISRSLSFQNKRNSDIGIPEVDEGLFEEEDYIQHRRNRFLTTKVPKKE